MMTMLTALTLMVVLHVHVELGITAQETNVKVSSAHSLL